MKLVTQPEGTRLCGQCCVAMLCDIDLEAASKLTGHARLTGPRLVTALYGRGIAMETKLLRARLYWSTRKPGDVYLGRVRTSKSSRSCHWTVLMEGVGAFDPLLGTGAIDELYAGPWPKLTSVHRVHLPASLQPRQSQLFEEPGEQHRDKPEGKPKDKPKDKPREQHEQPEERLEQVIEQPEEQLEERERTTHWYSALNQRWMKKVYVSDDDRHFQSHSLPADQEPPAGALVEVAVSGAWVPVRHVPGAWLSVLSSKLRRQRRSTRRSANRR